MTAWLTGHGSDRGPSGDALGLAGAEEAQANLQPPRGRWAIERLADSAVVGALVIRMLPPRLVDMEVSFQLRPEEWGMGTPRGLWGTHPMNIHAGHRRAVRGHHAGNTRAIATTERLGMQWVGETDKYYARTMQVYRIRPSVAFLDWTSIPTE